MSETRTNTSEDDITSDDPDRSEILHRCSLYSLFLVVVHVGSIFKPKQREAVRQIGFAKMLQFQVDSIPENLGLYVVDKFNQENMELDLGGRKIKVDAKLIHKLLGIPNFGLELAILDQESEQKLDDKNLEAPIMEWKMRYKDTITPRMIEFEIRTSKDDDSFNFKLDFIMLFLSTMVTTDCNGTCKLSILHQLSAEVNFSEINWCKYVVDCMKKCKDEWATEFKGTVAILTLLYVESITCEVMRRDRRLPPITFWNGTWLKYREDFEIAKGGFGQGELVVMAEDEDLAGTT
ncbi:hypothetical protein SSX86_032518 [Deinandra increscens subsp. villosa]|uniref:Uncharacterized protein n=1 Tax=Deinandra increscens subsp. villosa TaxID=3103831 RepID=A0AAP0C7Q7_9ASTR